MLDSESALGVSLVMVLLLVSASGDVVASLAFELVRSERINEFDCERRLNKFVLWPQAVHAATVVLLFFSKFPWWLPVLHLPLVGWNVWRFATNSWRVHSNDLQRASFLRDRSNEAFWKMVTHGALGALLAGLLVLRTISMFTGGLVGLVAKLFSRK